MKPMTGQLYIEHMAATVKETVKKLETEANVLRKKIEAIESQIQHQRTLCPHIHLEEHPRQAIDDHDWNECLDCGQDLD